MASRWDYPDPATAFANSFMSTFTPFLQARMQQDTKATEAVVSRIIDNYDKASAAAAKGNADWAQYKADAENLVNMMGEQSFNGIPKAQITAYAADLLRWHKGNVSEVQTLLHNQLSNGIISYQDINEVMTATSKAVNSGAPTPDIGSPTDAQTVSAFQNSIETAESSNNPTAWNTDRNGNLYAGLYQFGDARLEEVNAALGTNYTATDLKAGLVPAAEQRRMAQWHFGQIDDFIKSENLDRFIGTSINGTAVTANGMRAVAHLGGNAGLKRYLESGGQYNPHDGKEGQVGTYLSDYMARFGNGVPSTGSTAPSDPAARSSLASTYNLTSLEDATDDRSFLEKAGDNLTRLFNPNDQSWIITEGRREARRQLEASGDLETYEAMVRGDIALSNTVGGGYDGIKFNFDAADMEDFPNIATIGSADEIASIRVAISNGLIRADENELAALDALEVRFAELPQGLPKNLMDLNSDRAIKSAYDIYNGLTDEEKAKLPTGYGTRLASLFGTVDTDTGKLSINHVFSRLSQLKAAATRDGATEEDKAELGMYVNQSLVSLVNQALAVNTDQTVAERFGVLQEVNAIVQTLDNVSPEVTKGLQDSYERIRQSADAAANPEGRSQDYVISDGNGGFEWRKVYTKPTLGGNTTYYIDDNGQEVPFDRANIINMPSGHIEARQTIVNQMDDQRQRYNNAIQDNRGFFSTVGQMGKIIANDPLILGADVVNNLGAAYVDLTRNVEVATARLAQLNGNTEAQKEFFTSGDADAIIQELDRQVAQIEADPMRNNAANFHLFKAKQVLAAYKIGRLEGQSGTAMSNRDFDNFSRAINAKSVKEFMDGMGAYARSIQANMDIRRDDLLTDPRVEAWEATINGKVDFWSGDMTIKGFTDDYDKWSPEEQLGYRMFLGDPVTQEKEETKPDWTFDPNSATLSFD